MPRSRPTAATATIPAAVIAAFQLLWLAWRRTWLALLLAGAALGLTLETGAVLGRSPWTAAACLAALLFVVVATAAVCRLALGRDGRWPRWRDDEWRVLGAAVLVGLLGLVLGLLVLILVLCIAYGVAAAGKGFVGSDPASWAAAVDGRGRVIVGAVALAGAAAVVWVMVRVSLAPLASVARRRVQVLSTWPLTRSVVGRLLAAMVWVGLTPAALLLAVGSAGRLTRPGEAWAVASVHLAQAMVLAGIWLPLKVGVMGYFYGRAESDSH